MIIQKWPVEKLIPYTKNVKIHTDKQVEKIANSIKQFGWTTAIVVDKAGVIIQGHGRRLAAIKLGFAEVPVIVRDDLTEEEAKALRLTDNHVALGEYDTSMLMEELKGLDFDMLPFFDAKELEFMTADLGEINEDAFVPDLDAALEEQASETQEKIAASKDKAIPLAKAFGVKSIPGKYERLAATFMAKIEHDTGKEGEEALVAFLEQFAA